MIKFPVLWSFDVVSLFTNVPVELACRVAEERLSTDETLGDYMSLLSDQILSLLQFCLNATYLACQGQYYQQTFGTAMGSPVSVTVANLVISSFPDSPHFWKRYVDDICTVLHPENIQPFHCHLNSIESSI